MYEHIDVPLALLIGKHANVSFNDSVFLTDQDKKKILKSLGKNTRIDEKFKRHLKRINKIDGVVSNYCCVGHTGTIGCGYIVLMVNKDKHKVILNGLGYYLLDKISNMTTPIREVECDMFDGKLRWCFRWINETYLNEAISEVLCLLET